MPCYIVNKNAQSNGDHEVHIVGCDHGPDSKNQLSLGEHAKCETAVKQAQTTYEQSNGCFFCCNDCHTS